MPPLKYFVPNGITALSLLLGLGSVSLAVEQSYELAAWMILWASLLDKLDGTAARLFKATSQFGVEFDSFADFVSFGLAPAALIYFRLLHSGQWEGWYRTALTAAAGLYVVALAVRLARFNVTTSAKDAMFVGVPGTLVGSVVASAYLAWDKYHLGEGLLDYAPALLLGGAFLMVCGLRMPKLKLRKSRLFNAFQISNMAAAYILAPLRLLPEYLLGIGLLYLVGGLVVGMRTQPEEDEAEDPQEQPA